MVELGLGMGMGMGVGVKPSLGFENVNLATIMTHISNHAVAATKTAVRTEAGLALHLH